MMMTNKSKGQIFGTNTQQYSSLIHFLRRVYRRERTFVAF